MKIFDSRKSIVMASIGVLFASLALVSCEKREEPLLNEMAKYSKTIVFTEQQQQTRASYIDYTTAMPSAEYVLRTEEATDSLFLSEYVTDFATEQYITRAEDIEEEDLDEFIVLAYNVQDGTPRFNSDLTGKVVLSDGKWRYSPNEHNWAALGGNTVQFYAYTNIEVKEDGDLYGAELYENETSKFKLTLPEDPSEQTDIIVAKATNTYGSDAEVEVPLTFNHICAKVKFVVGSEKDIEGYIKSIKINNVYCVRDFDIQTGQWGDFDATAEPKSVTVLDGCTTDISMDEQIGETLMLIPQSLAGKTVDIEYVINNKTQSFTASFAGSWDAGNEYTYKISNHKIDLLSFKTQVPTQDAHYVIYPVEISLKAELKSAKLEAEILDLNGNSITSVEQVEMREGDPTPYESMGYWIDNNDYITLLSSYNQFEEADQKNIKKRDFSIQWDNINSDAQKTIYLFIPENASASNRKIKLTLTGKKENDEEANIKTLEFLQFCPTETGCERIEEPPFFLPWGPYWEIKGNNGSNVVTYSKNWSSGDFWGYVLLGLYGFDEDNWPKGVSFKYTFFGLVLDEITIDYSQYLTFDQSENDDNGLLNTQQVFGGGLTANDANMDELIEILNSLENAGLTVANGVEVGDVNVDDSAIVKAVRKNKYRLTSFQTDDGPKLQVTIPSDEIKWYLPSVSQFPSVLSVKNEPGETALDGTYWTSTISGGDLSMSHSKAYIWPNGPAQDILRSESQNCKVRAVRVVDWNE